MKNTTIFGEEVILNEIKYVRCRKKGSRFPALMRAPLKTAVASWAPSLNIITIIIVIIIIIIIITNQ